MGEVEIDPYHNSIIISSHIITYGNAADERLSLLLAEEIESMWNEPLAIVNIKGMAHSVRFVVSATVNVGIPEVEVISNTDPRNNYFRIEEYAHGNISFVDALGCNSGYFKVANLSQGSTTAAHEYGHTLGLEHPADIDYRGKGIPRIMYPRGTLVDPQYQYDPAQLPGLKGGTLDPSHRKVFQEDIDLLRLDKLRFKGSKAIIGEFTNVFHDDHGSALT